MNTKLAKTNHMVLKLAFLTSCLFVLSILFSSSFAQDSEDENSFRRILKGTDEESLERDVLIKERVRVEKSKGLDLSIIGAGKDDGTTNLKETTLNRKWIDIASKEGFPFSKEGLINAARNGNFTAVEALLKAGVPVNVNNIFNQTPLMAAIDKNRVHIAKYLIALGADVNAQNNKGETALIISSAKNHGASFNLLIDNGVDIDKTDLDGRTALYFAVQNNNIPMASILIALGADVNKANRFLSSPLMVASWKGNVKLVNRLIKAGADTNARDLNGNTPLILVVR